MLQKRILHDKMIELAIYQSINLLCSSFDSEKFKYLKFGSMNELV